MNMDKLKEIKAKFTAKRSICKSLEERLKFDSSRPLTTNKAQLKLIEVDTDVETNFFGIVEALYHIGVKVSFDPKKLEKAKGSLKNALEEKVPEHWGADDMQEYLDLTPAGLFEDNPENN